MAAVPGPPPPVGLMVRPVGDPAHAERGQVGPEVMSGGMVTASGAIGETPISWPWSHYGNSASPVIMGTPSQVAPAMSGTPSHAVLAMVGTPSLAAPAGLGTSYQAVPVMVGTPSQAALAVIGTPSQQVNSSVAGLSTPSYQVVRGRSGQGVELGTMVLGNPAFLTPQQSVSEGGYSLCNLVPVAPAGSMAPAITGTAPGYGWGLGGSWGNQAGKSGSVLCLRAI